MIPQELQNEYPFSSHFHILEKGHKMHYLDEGQKGRPVVLMLHGNPTWSFFYRHLIKALRTRFRLIVPDHLGMGLSDCPSSYLYCLRNHIANIQSLLDSLSIQSNHLVVHDWGAAIGFGLKGEHLRGKIVILNSAAFTDHHIPWQISLCRLPWIGEGLIRYANGFAWPASLMAVAKPLEPLAKKGFLWPYRRRYRRWAIAGFVQDIPMHEKHPSYALLKEIENNLSSIDGEKLILWGEKDFCFTKHFFKRWRKFYPSAEVKTFSNAGHYLLEDEREAVVGEIDHFLTV